MRALKNILRGVLSFKFAMVFMVFVLFPALFINGVVHGFQTGDSSVLLFGFLMTFACLFLFLLAILDSKGRL